MSQSCDSKQIFLRMALADTHTVLVTRNYCNFEKFAIILFSQIALKNIFGTLKNPDKRVIYLNQ